MPREKNESDVILETLKGFYTAYRSKDQGQWKKFWHDNSPVVYQRESDLAKWDMPAADKINSLDIEQGWDKTIATVEVALADGKIIRHAGLIKEGNTWKIWHESSSEAYNLAKQTVEKEPADNDLSSIADHQLTSALSWIGYTLYEKRLFDNSIKAFLLAHKSAEQMRDPPAGISALIVSGHDYLELGKYQDALRIYKQAYRISESSSFDIGSVRALSGMGNAANYLGEYFEARDAHERRLTLLRKGSNTRRISVTLKNLGNTYFYLGEFEKALASYEESERLGLRDTGLIINTGFTLAELGRFPESEKKLQHGLLLAREENNSTEIGHALNGLGQTEFKRGKYKEALSFFQQSLTEGTTLKKDEQAKIHLNKGYALFKLQDHAAASAAVEKGIQLAQESESPEPVWFGKYVLGKILKTENKRQQAFRSFEGSVDFIEDWLGKNNNTDGLESFFQDKVEPYREIVDLFVADGKDVNALEYAELSKARTLLRATKGVRKNAESVRKFSLRDADLLLKDNDTALLEYVVTEESTFLFLVIKSPKGNPVPQLTVKEIPIGRQQLENTIGSLRIKLSSENYDFIDEAEKLYENLIAPVEDKLANKKKLVIVPDSVIWGVPFQAVRTRSHKFLWEQFSITYARSLTSLVAQRNQSKGLMPQLRFLGVANPTSEANNSIPFAEESVKQIAPFYGLPSTSIYSGDAATEEQVKAVISNYDIVHFATHGHLNDRSPMSSYLELTTKDASEDGKLEANEIQRLNLRADLVVLAGCETGRGKLYDGEGIVGLSWALEKAGASTLIVSQWNVRDKNTRDLMVAFHRVWRESVTKNNSLSVSEAFRIAALSIKKKYPHPAQWAGFMVMGSSF